MSFPRMVVLIDAENVFGGYRENFRYVDFKHVAMNVGAIVREKVEADVALGRAYANWTASGSGQVPKKTRDDLLTMRRELERLSHFEPVHVKERKPNSADHYLVCDAIELALQNSLLDVFVIVSDDGDFAPVKERLRKYGRKVISVSTKEALRPEADDRPPAAATSTVEPKQTGAETDLVEANRTPPAPSRPSVADAQFAALEVLGRSLRADNDWLFVDGLIQALQDRFHIAKSQQIVDGFSSNPQLIDAILKDSPYTITWDRQPEVIRLSMQRISSIGEWSPTLSTAGSNDGSEDDGPDLVRWFFPVNPSIPDSVGTGQIEA